MFRRLYATIRFLTVSSSARYCFIVRTVPLFRRLNPTQAYLQKTFSTFRVTQEHFCNYSSSWRGGNILTDFLLHDFN